MVMWGKYAGFVPGARVSGIPEEVASSQDAYGTCDVYATSLLFKDLDGEMPRSFHCGIVVARRDDLEERPVLLVLDAITGRLGWLRASWVHLV